MENRLVMTRTSILAAALCLPLLLASCATLSDLPGLGSSDEAANAEAAPNEVAVDASPVEFVAPEGMDAETAALMARMEQLEHDMAEVRIELSRVLPAIDELAATSPANELDRNVAPANLRAGNAEAPTPPPEVLQASIDETRFSVHLASYRNREGAVEGWSELSQRFSPVLASLEPRVSQVNIEDRGIFFRLKAGPFQSWGAANEVCDYLRGSSWSCAVMDFTGDDIN